MKNLSVKALEKKSFVHRQMHFPFSALLPQAKEQMCYTFTIITRPDTQLRHKSHMGFVMDTFSSPNSSAISTHLSSLSPLNIGTIMINPLKI